MMHPIPTLFKSLTQGVYVIGAAHGEERNAFTAAWVMQVSFEPPLLALSISPEHVSYRLLKEGGGFSVNVLKADQLEIAAHYGAERSDKLSAHVWTTGKLGLPLLGNALAWFECRLVHDYPAGDHVLALGEVIGGKLLDASATPLSYADTGNMDGAAALFPDRLGE